MITSYEQVRIGNVTRVTAVSDLEGTVYFHWYLDGLYLGGGTADWRSVYLAEGEQARIEAVDTTDPAFDPVANAPQGFPRRRTLWWISAARPGVADLAAYRIEQSVDGGESWTVLARASHADGQWTYEYLTGVLADLTDHRWRIVPVDRAGNDGQPIEIGPETVVRRPDSPAFTAQFDAGTSKVTFAAA